MLFDGYPEGLSACCINAIGLATAMCSLSPASSPYGMLGSGCSGLLTTAQASARTGGAATSSVATLRDL